MEGFSILLLECGNVKKYYGDRLIIDLENLHVYSTDRIGIVGVNGAGKTTLINILSQKIEPDEGWVRLYEKSAFVSQLEPPGNKTLSSEMASKFGVPGSWQENMSGGEQTRFKLAVSFSDASMLMFADEPTSNVDMEGIELMENLFAEYRGGLLLITHDRSLLDKLCNKILEIDSGRIRIYNGNYSEYRLQKAKESERKQFEYLKYVKEKKRLANIGMEIKQKSKSIRKAPKRMGISEARLHKMGDQRAKASLDQARKNIETRIEHLQVKEKPIEQKRIKFDIAESKKIYSKIIIEGNDLSKHFAGKVIFKDAEFKIKNGAKVALIGPNGCGKTTLLEMILQQDPGIKIAPAAKIGYFSQDMNILKDDFTILENVMEKSIYQESFARTFLARLLFKGDDVYKRVKSLSGGERVKVAFAKILMEDINLLILDEPTNYLDIKSLEVIEEALRNYNRTLIIVSHDRRLISSVADHIMTIKNHEINMFKGNYTEYLNRKKPAADQNREELEKQSLILQHQLTEIISRLSLPNKQDDLKALDQQYQKVLEELKRIKTRLGDRII